MLAQQQQMQPAVCAVKSWRVFLLSSSLKGREEIMVDTKKQ